MDSTKDNPNGNHIEKGLGSRPKLSQLHSTYDYSTAIGDGDHGNLKTTKDGRTVLFPQPSEDPKDPLNWSTTKKHIILFIISFAAFLPDYGSATGAVTLIPQAV
jgi:hypothetical protein